MKDHRRFKESEDRASNRQPRNKHQRRPQFNNDEDAIDLRLLKNCTNVDIDEALDLLESTQSKYQQQQQQ